MSLSPPQIVGPISECNTSVRVKGQITGAKVQIILNGDTAAPIGEKTATWSDQVIQLSNLPPTGLVAGDTITAIQIYNDETSPQSAVPAEVQKFVPSQLGDVLLRTHPYQCGRHLWFDGVVPGATVVVGEAGDRGQAVSPDGHARVTINPPIKEGESLAFRQIAKGELGPMCYAPVAEAPLAYENKLFGINYAVEPKACDRTIRVTDVIDGADIVLDREVQSQQRGASLSSWMFVIGNPGLVKDEEIGISQKFEKCKHYIPSIVLHRTIEQAKPVEPPEIVGPLCADATLVLVKRLNPGSQFQVLIGNTEIARAEAADEEQIVSVAPLKADKKLVVKQERCGKWSAASDPAVKVGKAPETIDKPEIVGKKISGSVVLFECAASVPVRNLHPGAQAVVYSKTFNGPISDVVAITSAEMLISVSPVLTAGDSIHVRQFGCGTSTGKSSAVKVVKLKPELLQPPVVREPICAWQNQIFVDNVIPGAMVEVYVNEKVFGTVIASGETVTVWSDTNLPTSTDGVGEGDHVNARQIFCNHDTPIHRDDDVIVVSCNPRKPVGLNPASGIHTINPSFSWQDPGVNQPWAATDYTIEVKIGSNSPVEYTGVTSPYSLTDTLPYSTSVKWRVKGHNDHGFGDWSAHALFTTEAAPEQPPPSTNYTVYFTIKSTSLQLKLVEAAIIYQRADGYQGVLGPFEFDQKNEWQGQLVLTDEDQAHGDWEIIPEANYINPPNVFTPSWLGGNEFQWFCTVSLDQNGVYQFSAPN